MQLKVDLRVPTGGTVTETAEFVAQCERAGFDGVGIIDHQHTGRDVFLTLALAANRTHEVTLYPAVTNPVTRHPMVLASIAHSLEEIAPRRIILCVGAGFMSTRHINRSSATVTEMRSVVMETKRLLAGEQVYPGLTEGKLIRASDPPTPVYICATGPRMIELAGEIADGAMLMVGLHPEMLTDAMDSLDKGARRAGRTVEEIPLTLVAGGVLSDSRRSAVDTARGFCLGQMNHPINGPRLKKAGIDWPDALRDPDTIPEDLLTAVCDATGLFGTANDWVDGIKNVSQFTAASRLFIQPNLTYDHPVDLISKFRDDIRPLTIG